MMEKLKVPLLALLAIAAVGFGVYALSSGMGGGNPTNNDITKAANEVQSTRTDTPRVPQELLNKGVGAGTRNNGMTGVKKGGQ